MAENETLAVSTESAAELFQNGQLDDAIAAQIQAVKADPTNENKRLFLFELLVFAGQWDRAGRQLDAIHYEDPERSANVAAYRALLDAERQRDDVLASGKRPEFLLDPPADAEKRVEALACLAQGQAEKAATILRQLDEEAAPLKGQLNETPFEVLRDCDDLFGTMLEVFSSTGRYYWAPMRQIDTLTVIEPKQLRDLAWLPATLQMQDGPTGDVFLPVRYPGSENHPDGAIRVAKSTDWIEREDGPTRGCGVKLYLAGDDAVALPDWRTLTVQ